MKDFESLPMFLSTKQMAEITGQHINTIRRDIAQGKIPADKLNGRWLVCKDLVFPAAKEAFENARG